MGTPHRPPDEAAKAKEDLAYQQARYEQAKKEADEKGIKYDEEIDYKRWHGKEKDKDEPHP
jgi:hypothetical protein